MLAAGAIDSANADGAPSGNAATDTLNLQASLKLGAGKVVQPPPGTYLIKAPLRVPNGTELDLHGVTLKRAPGFDGNLITKASPISGFVMRGGSIDNSFSEGGVLHFRNGSSNITVSDVEFLNLVAGTTCALALYVLQGAAKNADITVELCRFYGADTNLNQNAIIVNEPQNFRTRGNTFWRTGGIKCETTNAGQAGSGNARGVSILDDWFEGVGGSCVLVRPNGTSTIEDVEVRVGGRDVGVNAGKGLVVVGEHVGSNAKSRLNGRISAADTTIKVDSTDGFQEHGVFWIKGGSGNELVAYSGKTATQFRGCTRGYGVTTPARHRDKVVVKGTAITRNVTITVSSLSHFGGNAISVGGGRNHCFCEQVTINPGVIDGRNAAGVLDPNLAQIGVTLIDTLGFTIQPGAIRYTGISGIRLLGCRKGSIRSPVIEHAVQCNRRAFALGDREGGIAMFYSGGFGHCDAVSISGPNISNCGTPAFGARVAGVAGVASQGTHRNITIGGGGRIFDDRPTKCQRYGVRLGVSQAAAEQPRDWHVDIDLQGNATSQVRMFNARGKGHILFLRGTGAPTEQATLGSEWTRLDGAPGTTKYLKESDDGGTGGWVAR